MERMVAHAIKTYNRLDYAVNNAAVEFETMRPARLLSPADNETGTIARTMEISIRELIPEKREEDLETLVPTYLQIWNHPDNLAFLSFTGRPFEDEQLRQWCRGHLDAGVRYFGAFSSDERLLAILLTRQNPIEGFELVSIGVLPAEKRQGVGRQLVLHGLDVAREDGYRAIDGQVYATNAPMLRLLLGEGFVPVRMEHRRGPEGEDLVHLKREL